MTLSQRPFCLTLKLDKAVELQHADGPGRWILSHNMRRRSALTGAHAEANAISLNNTFPSVSTTRCSLAELDLWACALASHLLLLRANINRWGLRHPGGKEGIDAAAAAVCDVCVIYSHSGKQLGWRSHQRAQVAKSLSASVTNFSHKHAADSSTCTVRCPPVDAGLSFSTALRQIQLKQGGEAASTFFPRSVHFQPRQELEIKIQMDSVFQLIGRSPFLYVPQRVSPLSDSFVWLHRTCRVYFLIFLSPFP